MARIALRPIAEQVMVITGASSGIGLAAARIAGRRGARVVLVARDPAALREAAQQVREEGGEVAWISADVADARAMDEAARFAVERFGRIDTWVNNAGIHLFGRLVETRLADQRRILEVNYWGAVNGSRAALPYLSEQGGALLNVGSVLSSRSVPMQGIYTASKHALKGWTDSLRIELQADDVPVVVTLIMPAAIDTPIAEHSKNLMDARAQLPPPLYDPLVAGRAIVDAATRHRRQIVVGGAGQIATLGEEYAPTLVDHVMKWVLIPLQRRRGPIRRTDTLHGSVPHPARLRGSDRRFVLRRSLYTWAEMHPMRAGLLAFAGGLGLWMWRRRRA